MSRFKLKGRKILENTCERQLKDIDFIGGTFVEYENGSNKELYRGTISKFKCTKNSLSIQTKESDESTNLLKLGTPHLLSIESSIREVVYGVWYINSGIYLGWTVAIAPKGVIIE